MNQTHLWLFQTEKTYCYIQTSLDTVWYSQIEKSHFSFVSALAFHYL